MDINWIVDSPFDPLPVGDPDQVAISMEGTEELTYRDLRDLRNRMVNGLLDAGIEPGDRVGILLTNSAEYLALYFAIARLGAVAVRLNFRLSAQEFDYILGDSGCRMVCFHSSRAPQVESLKETSNVEQWVAFPDTDDEVAWATPSAELMRGSSRLTELPRPLSSDVLMLMYTSGTTGRPKGAIWTHEAALWLASLEAVKWSLTSATTSLTTGPFYHVGAFENLQLPTLYAHGTAVFMRSGDMSIDKVTDVIERTGVTDALLYPFLVYDLLRTDPSQHAKVKTLKFILTGGDPLRGWAIAALDETFPSIEFAKGYGLTEGGAMATVLDHEHRHTHPDSVGRPLNLTEVGVFDAAGAAADPGIVGEVWVRNPAVSIGYWNKPQETAETFIDGWCRTGDLGVITSDGFLKITGRSKDMIRSGGENIYPAEVEEVLTSIPGIAEAAVVAVPDERYLEVGCAVLVMGLNTDFDEASIRTTCRRNLAGYKVPKYFVVVDSLPRNGGGKVLKHELRSQFKDIESTALGAAR